MTQPPDWGHGNFGDKFIDVDLPPVPQNSVVILLGLRPTAYLAAFLPPTVQVIGVENNFLKSGPGICPAFLGVVCGGFEAGRLLRSLNPFNDQSAQAHKSEKLRELVSVHFLGFERTESKSAIDI